MASGKANKPKLNDFVQKDGVIKEQVAAEEKTSSEWDQKWGYLKDFHKFCVEAAAERGISEEEYERMRKKYKTRKQPDLFVCDVKPSGGVPKTSSGFVGWRSSRLECSLEKFGPQYISPRLTINPPDQPEIQVSCIILG